MSRALTLAIGLVAWLPALGASAEQLTLEEAMSRGRRAAREVTAAEARVEASRARLRQARGYRLPTVSVSEIWMRTDSPADVFALQLNQERFSFSDFVASDPNTPDKLENATTRLELTLPLYTGGQLTGRIEQAALAAEAATSQVERAADEAALAAGEAYIRLAQAREHVELVERALETVEAHVALARAYAEQGMIVRSELLRAEVEQARIHDLLLEARGQERLAAANLSFRLTAEPAGTWETEDLPEPPPFEDPLSRWQTAALDRADLTASRRLLAAGELEVGISKSARLPKIGLVARSDLVDSSLFGTSGDSTAVMAMASIDLWGGGRHAAAAAAARAELEAATAEVEQFAAAIELQVEDAFERVLTAQERHETAAAALAAAREVERIVEERFRQGVVRTIDVLDAATARREAEMRELMARTETHLARLRLAATTGDRPESMIADPTTAGSAAKGSTR
jgi:outer membrane protein TolC